MDILYIHHIYIIYLYIPKHIVSKFNLQSDQSPNRRPWATSCTICPSRRRQRGCLSPVCLSHRTECKAQHETSIIKSPDLKGLWSVRVWSSWNSQESDPGLAIQGKQANLLAMLTDYNENNQPTYYRDWYLTFILKSQLHLILFINVQAAKVLQLLSGHIHGLFDSQANDDIVHEWCHTNELNPLMRIRPTWLFYLNFERINHTFTCKMWAHKDVEVS